MTNEGVTTAIRGQAEDALPVAADWLAAYRTIDGALRGDQGQLVGERCFGVQKGFRLPLARCQRETRLPI